MVSDTVQTSEAIFLIQRLQDWVDAKQVLYLLFLDWSKAFDTIKLFLWLLKGLHTLEDA